MNTHEELSDRSAPYADFGHGSLFEAAPGARRFVHSAESPTKFLFKPMVGYMRILKGVKAIPSGATPGHDKPPSSGQAAPSLDLHLGVRYEPPNTGYRGWYTFTNTDEMIQYNYSSKLHVKHASCKSCFESVDVSPCDTSLIG